ncbi:MAG TPA: gamma-glutamyltransferase family protein [Ferrovibrio sp.]|uniref:gamma-glutamyltransferase family protein n=1 Tax=Ferrovibrio sp. TaxID=1917215 RepID=UPI002ED6AE28
MFKAPFAFTTRPEIKGNFGVVATTHWIASSAAMGVLERGGNAFDAAVTAAFVLHLAEPHLNGPGGDLPALMWSARKRKIEVLCGQGPAPEKATIAHFKSLGLDLIPGSGLLAPCVPGAVDGWLLMLRDYGTIDVAEALAPAIHYATNGCPLVPRVIDTISTVQALFRDEWKTSAAIWLDRTGALPKPFALFRQEALGATYARLAQIGKDAAGNRERKIDVVREAWREGFVAEAIDRFCSSTEAMDASGRRHRGVLSGDDMAKWQAHIEAPLTYDYHGWTVAKCGPWSQGPVFLQQLALLKGFDLAAMDPAGPEFIHIVVEAAKLAFADREAWYGDPDHVDVPMHALLSDAYNAERRKLIADTASLELRPGDPTGKVARLASVKAGSAGGAGIGEPTVGRLAGSDGAISKRGAASGDTCQIDVIDRWGNMVAATPSGGWLQSSPAIPELGFCLGTRAQMFWLEEGLPNSLKPGKRPRTTLSPSMALKDGKPAMAFGTPGGDQQDQWSPQLFLKVLHHGMNLQEAIDSPAWHSEHFPSSFYPRASRPGHLALEGRMPKETVEALKARGHKLEVGGDWSEGRLCACATDETPEGTLLRAGANPRGMQGYAVGR